MKGPISNGSLKEEDLEGEMILGMEEEVFPEERVGIVLEEETVEEMQEEEAGEEVIQEEKVEAVMVTVIEENILAKEEKILA